MRQHIYSCAEIVCLFNCFSWLIRFELCNRMECEIFRSTPGIFSRVIQVPGRAPFACFTEMRFGRSDDDDIAIEIGIKFMFVFRRVWRNWQLKFSGLLSNNKEASRVALWIICDLSEAI